MARGRRKGSKTKAPVMKSARLYPGFNQRSQEPQVTVEPLGGTQQELEHDLNWLELDWSWTPNHSHIVVPEVEAFDLADLLGAAGWSCSIASDRPTSPPYAKRGAA
jgi:hypothetical protein